MRPRTTLVSFSWLVLLICPLAVGCAWAQNFSNIFLPPVANAPFTGVIVVERTNVSRDGGPALQLKTTREVARDSQGRVYDVSRQLVPASQSGAAPIIRIQIYDPQTGSYTYLYPERKIYVTGTVDHPPAATPWDLVGSPAGNSVPLNQSTKREDLGTHSIGGVSAHGVREIQTTHTTPTMWRNSCGPRPASTMGIEIVRTHEYWYSDDLHMQVVVKHNDPSTGSATITLTQVKRGEPDSSLFQIPDGYKWFATSYAAGDPHSAPTGVYRIGAAVSAPKLISAPDPEFPSGEREGGVVVVSCIVDDKGQPWKIHVVRSLSDTFDKNAVRAVEQYRFTPAMLHDAQPVAVELNIEVNFRPPN
jgi:TonB family protein